MKKHSTFEGEPEEMPFSKNKPEMEQPYDPKEPEIPQKEIEEIPEELPYTGSKPGKKSDNYRA